MKNDEKKMNAQEAQSPLVGQFPDRDKIICKDCIFRDKTIVTINEKEIAVGVTKAFCQMFKEPPKSNGKPHEVLFNNEECELYIKEV